MKKVILSIVLFLALTISLSGCYAGPRYSAELKESFVVVKDIENAREDIESHGGTIRHIFPDENVLIGSVPKKFRSKYIKKIYYETSNVPSEIKSTFTSWKRSLDYKRIPLEEKLATIPDVEPIYDDFIMIEKPSLDALTIVPRGLPLGAEATDTSLFFMGEINVNVIFPESNDVVCIDPPACDNYGPDSENWTDQEIQEVKDEIFLAMDWWDLREPDAHPTFVYNYAERVPVDLEPIEESSVFRDFWINDIMLNLGHGPEQYPATPLVYDYLNNYRDLNENNWGFVIFVVDSSNDADGMFSDGKFAFATGSINGGGPYLVMTYDNQNYGIENMDSVAAHETGHIFGALDQYGACTCTESTGYLYYENQNCVDSCLINEDSIMRGGITPFTLGLVDYYARGQIGWQDTDGDNILDVEDTIPGVILNQHTQNGDDFYFDGDSWINIFPAINPFYNNASINTIANVEYRYNPDNTGWTEWFYSDASDGLFDSAQELYEFVLNSLPGGNYVIQTRAINNVENPTNEEDYGEDYVTVTGIPPMCHETDAGYDIYNYGVVTDDYGTYEDFCNQEMLYEYFCGGDGMVDVAEVNCYTGCSGGECNTRPGTKYKFAMFNPDIPPN
jgi:hypothetical protein